MEVPMYEGNLNVEKFLYWINAMEKYFKYEDIDEENKFKNFVTRSKGHASLWCDELKDDRRKKGKAKIMNWDRIMAKFKAKFIPKDYQLNLFIKLLEHEVENYVIKIIYIRIIQVKHQGRACGE
jgi:hypothetical protein